jgi:hypothetical protein
MRSWSIAWLAIMTVACGHHNNGNGGPGDPDGGGSGSAADANIDAWRFGGMCTPGGAACSNCIDDDGDGLIDGFDPECTGPLDNDEATFSTGIPGDNKDPVEQDCFFDGDSGAGNDGCNIHVCCLLGAQTVADCKIGANRYNPNDCPPPLGTKPLSQQCIDTCGKLTPPGCDCFGCCTVCEPDPSPGVPGACFDIDINPADSVGCGPTTLGDPTKCLSCTKNTQCGSSPCGGTTCILCPGQGPGDLPSGCNMMNMCPNGEQTCTPLDPTCPASTFCSNGCCIGVIQ